MPMCWPMFGFWFYWGLIPPHLLDGGISHHIIIDNLEDKMADETVTLSTRLSRCSGYRRGSAGGVGVYPPPPPFTEKR